MKNANENYIEYARVINMCKTGKVSFDFVSDLIGFESYSDAEKVASAIKRMLEDATKC